MRKPTPWGAQSDPGGDREVYEDMLNDQLSGSIADSGQLGVAKIVEAQLKASAENRLATMDAGARMQVERKLKNN
jgi:Rod binding domain-containing protein